MDLKRDMSWKSRFLRWGVFLVILKPDKTTDWRNTDHCFLVSWIWKGTCPGNHGFSDEAYFKSYWNMTKQQIDETQIIVTTVNCNTNSPLYMNQQLPIENLFISTLISRSSVQWRVCVGNYSECWGSCWTFVGTAARLRY